MGFDAQSVSQENVYRPIGTHNLELGYSNSLQPLPPTPLIPLDVNYLSVFYYQFEALCLELFLASPLRVGDGRRLMCSVGLMDESLKKPK